MVLSDLLQFTNKDKYLMYFMFLIDNCFTLEIHHGGRFVRLGSGSRHYRGGEEVWIDEVDPDTISWICLNCMAEDLGYREPPMTYWFKIPGSTNGEEFLPIRDDKEVNEMLAFIQTSKVLQLYIVGGGVRKKKRKQSLRIKEGIIRNQFTMPSTLVM